MSDVIAIERAAFIRLIGAVLRLASVVDHNNAPSLHNELDADRAALEKMLSDLTQPAAGPPIAAGNQ